jgi:hypothetical protein
MVLNPSKLGEIFENYTEEVEAEDKYITRSPGRTKRHPGQQARTWKLEAILLTSYYLLITTNNNAGRNC